MASNAKMFKIKKVAENENLSCDIFFDGGLHSNTRASLVIELIKYFMFERQQIPLSFEQAKKDIEITRSGQQQGTSGAIMKKGLKHRLTEKRACTALDSLDTIFKYLEKSFEQCPEISAVMIILGGTIISPKETYHIVMPSLSPDAENLVFKSCVKALFRQLITQDLLGNVKPISPTNMSVLLKAPRNCKMDWFTPHHSFKVPKRGQMFTYNCLCKQPVVHSRDLTHDHQDLEISGIDCLDSIDIDMSEMMLNDLSLSELLSQRVSFGRPRRSIHANSDFQTEHKLSECEQDSIWFQSPISVKGYRHPAPKKI